MDWYLRDGEEESGKEMGKKTDRAREMKVKKTESLRFRVSSGIGTEEHRQRVIKKVGEAHEPPPPTEVLLTVIASGGEKANFL